MSCSGRAPRPGRRCHASARRWSSTSMTRRSRRSDLRLGTPGTWCSSEPAGPGAPCLLVSPVPSLATLSSGAALEVPSRNEERAGWPILEVVDRTQEEPWRRSLISSRLLRYLVDPDRLVVCVLNAPGRARRLACRSCRALQRCERCQAAVAQVRDGGLRCARCGAGASGGVPELRRVGAGRAPARGERAAQPARVGGRATGGGGDGSGPGRQPGAGRRVRRDRGRAASCTARRRGGLSRLRRRTAGAALPSRRAGPRTAGPRRPAPRAEIGRRAPVGPDPPAPPRGAGRRAARRPGAAHGGGTRPASRARPAAGQRAGRGVGCRRRGDGGRTAPGSRRAGVGTRRRPLPGASGGCFDAGRRVRVDAPTPRPGPHRGRPTSRSSGATGTRRPCHRSRRSACVGDLRAQRGIRRHKSPGALRWVRRARGG